MNDDLIRIRDDAIHIYDTGRGRRSVGEIKQAVAILIFTVYRDMFRWRAKHLVNESDVDDLLQKFWLHLCDEKVQSQWNSQLGEWFPWARRVLSGLASDLRRTGTTRVKHLEQFAASRDTDSSQLPVDAQAADSQFWQDLKKVLDAMKDSPNSKVKLCYRIHVLRHSVAKKSLKQIAKELSLSESQVRTLSGNAVELIRQGLADRGHDEPPSSPYDDSLSSPTDP